MKKIYSFDKYGRPAKERAQSDLFRTTMRSTLQTDTPYYQEVLAPYDVKHAIVDPSHTFISAEQNRLRKLKDFSGRSFLKVGEMSSKEIQSVGRQTQDFRGNTIYRLPHTMQEFAKYNADPVETYIKTRKANKEFFEQAKEQQLDVTNFAKPSYLARPEKIQGMASFKQYLLDSKAARRFGG
jgi:coenzyme F420-reducing hydrogenase alpha subunit